MNKLLLILLISLSSLMANYGLDDNQIQVLQKAYNQAKNYKTEDGFSFKEIILAIYLQESSAGIDIIGDNYTSTGKVKSLYESSLGSGQIQLGTAQTVLHTFPYLETKYGNLLHDNVYSYQKYVQHLKNIDKFKTILDSDELKNNSETLKGIETKKWAEFELKRNETILKEKYWNDLKKDNILVNKLIIDVDFSAIISTHYLIMCYNEAKKLGYEPVYSTISRYNGGWKNDKYYNNVMARMDLVKKLIKEKIIK